MGTYERRRCPIDGTACVTHCKSPYCPWWRCPREACRAVISFRRGLGYQRLPGTNGAVVNRPFAFPPATPPGG